MSKNLIINGLLKEDLGTLASQIALWENMNIWNVAHKKLKGLYTSIDEINKEIEEDKRTLFRKHKRNPSALEAKILKSLCDHLSIDTTKVKSIGDLVDLGEEIEKRVILLQKKISKDKFRGDSIQELIQFNLKRMFDDLSKNFATKSVEDQKEIVKRIVKVLEEMPDEQKEILRKKLNVDKITDQAVAKAIITGALGVGFAAVVEVAGFSAFIFAVEALAATAGLVGLTLPFAAYTTLTSIMAALANPFLIIPATLGLGYFLTERANKQIHDALLPILITQIAVSSSKEGNIISKDEKLIRKLKSISKKENTYFTKAESWIKSLRKRSKK